MPPSPTGPWGRSSNESAFTASRESLILAATTNASVDSSMVGSGADTNLFDAALFATPQTFTIGTLQDITEAHTIDATALRCCDT